MKKNVIIVIILGILTGFLFGNLVYKNYSGIEYLNEDGNIYYVQYGVYTSLDAANSNASKLNNYLIKETDDKYYIYLGVTTNYNTALKIQNLYNEKDIHTYIRSDYVNNSETLTKLKEYDLKLENLELESEIQEVIQEIFQESSLNL